MSTEAESDPAELCLRCSHPNPPGSPRCTHCNAPLGSLSSGAPWEMTKVRDVAYRTQTDPKLKPIVFFGVWLYFGPTAIAAALLALDAVNSALDPLTGDRSAPALLGLLAAFYLILSIWALTAVTRRYLSRTTTEDDE